MRVPLVSRYGPATRISVSRRKPPVEGVRAGSGELPSVSGGLGDSNIAVAVGVSDGGLWSGSGEGAFGFGSIRGEFKADRRGQFQGRCHIGCDTSRSRGAATAFRVMARAPGCGRDFGGASVAGATEISAGGPVWCRRGFRWRSGVRCRGRRSGWWLERPGCSRRFRWSGRPCCSMFARWRCLPRILLRR